MIAIATLVLAVPLGFFVSSRSAAFVAYMAVYVQLFVFQTAYLTRQWVDGDHSAFPKDADNLGFGYLVVTSVIFAVGFLLVALGHRLATRRRSSASVAID